MIEGLQLTIPQRLKLIRTTLIISLIVSVLLSFRLWAGDRNFPHAPLFEGFYMQPYLHFILMGLLLLFWLAALFLKYQRLFITLSILLSALMIFLDLNRLQPWFYIYLCMLFVFIFYNGRVDNSNRYTSYLIVLQLILASVYFFNGISAINPYFTEEAFTGIIRPIQHIMSDRQFRFFVKAGKFVPYVLLFIGLGLTISAIRFLATILAIIFHLLLFVLLFPSSNNSNYALWMANLSFLIMMLLLFSGRTKQKYFSPTVLFQRFVFYPVLLFLLILPFFNSFGYWPDFLSSNFKSGNNYSAKLSLSEMAYTRLPAPLKTYCYRENFNYTINHELWCEKELNADCFPDKIVFRHMYEYLVEQTGGNRDEVNLDQLPKHKVILKP